MLFFSANQKVFHLQKALRFTLKSLSFSQPKHRLFEPLFIVLKNRLFTYKKLSFAQAVPCWFQKPPIFTNQKPFFCTNFFLFPPKTTLFHPPPPIRTTLHLLFTKNTAVLLISTLISYAVKPERRTDSNHCRRYSKNCRFLRCRLPDECRSLSLQKRIDRRFESRSQDGVPRAFWLLFARCKK